MLAPNGERAVPALSDCSFGIHETVILYCHSGACSEWNQGGARITGLYDLFVGRTMPVTILLPRCLLHVETGRCPHCLICCMIPMMLAPSGDRAVPASLYCLICVPMILLVMVQ